jgi:hypothetical protein
MEMNRGKIDPPNNIHIYMLGDNIDLPIHTHGHGQPQHCPPPQKKLQHIHIDIDRGNIDLQHMYINRGTIIPPLHMVMNIDNMHMHIDMDRGDMNSGNISVPQTHTHGHDQRQH